MKIGINASFLRKQNTGIGQVTVNFLRELAEIYSPFGKYHNSELYTENEFYIYLEEDIDFDFPSNFHKRIFLPKYKRDDLIRKIWWEKFLLPFKVKKDGCNIFFSLYQSPTVFSDKNIKHIMLVHDLIPKIFPEYLNNWRKKMYQFLIEIAIKKTHKIIANSHRTEKDIIRYLGIRPGKIAVSYLDVDRIYKKELSEGEILHILKKYKIEKDYIYTAGGMEMRKNIEGVLRAYKIFIEQSGSLTKLPKLVISGKIFPESFPLATNVKEIIKGLKLEKKVILLGEVPQNDMPALYKGALFFVRPSFYEGFGLPELEAMNQGVPVITSKNSSLPEVGVDAVLYCDPKNIDDIAMVMKNVFKNEYLRKALSQKAKERSTHFSWEKFVIKFLNIINENQWKK